MSSIAESAFALTALPFAISSKMRAISLGVVTPRPYLVELSTATLAIRRKTLECTFVCGRPSASLLGQIIDRHENCDFDQARRRECLVASQREPLAGIEIVDRVTEHAVEAMRERIECA